MAPEHEQVQVELARPPALALLPAERSLELLEGDEQGDGARLGVVAARDVEGGRGIPELGLIDEPDGFCRVESRHPRQPGAREPGERVDAGSKARRAVPEIGPEPDVRPHPSSQVSASAR